MYRILAIVTLAFASLFTATPAAAANSCSPPISDTYICHTDAPNSNLFWLTPNWLNQVQSTDGGRTKVYACVPSMIPPVLDNNGNWVQDIRKAIVQIAYSVWTPMGMRQYSETVGEVTCKGEMPSPELIAGTWVVWVIVNFPDFGFGYGAPCQMDWNTGGFCAYGPNSVYLPANW